MNQKRLRNSKQLSWHEKRHKIARPTTPISLADLLQADQVNQDSPDSHQINSLPQPLQSRWRYSCWSYFSRGLFWGGLVSLTSIFSAIGGMALTKIDLVEQQIANQLSGNLSRNDSQLLPEADSDLNTPPQKQLESDRLTVDLRAKYNPRMQPKGQGLVAKSSSQNQNEPFNTPLTNGSTLARDNPFWDQPVAVQNTTNNPELGQRVVAYLRHRNFRDVYLVKHMPLKLEQTKIVTNYGKVETANYLKNILGFGNLESSSAQPKPELVLQLGKDAVNLPINYRSY